MRLMINFTQTLVWIGLCIGWQEMPSTSLLLEAQPDLTGDVGGTLLDPNGAVIVGKTVVLTNVSTGQVSTVSADIRGRYELPEVEGVYQLGLEDSPDLLPYRRAYCRIAAGSKIVVNLYPVQRTGFAMTVHGDVRLPDRSVSYDSFPLKGSARGPSLNLVIQYEKRTSMNRTTIYEGRQTVTTFDQITVSAPTITVNTDTLVASGADTAVIDLGGAKVTAPNFELDPTSRVLRIKREDKVETREF